MEKERTNYFIYFAVVSITIAMFSTGTCYSWTSPFLPKFNSSDPSVNPISRPLTTSEAGWMVSIINLGLLIGPIFPALITEKFGKKKTLLISTFPLLVAHIICSVSTSVIFFLVARIIMGLATGAVWTVIPVYLGEICEPKNRGLLSSLMMVTNTLGVLFGYATGPFLSMTWFSIVNLIPIIIFYFFVFFFIPDSPYDLIIENKFQKAEESLKTLRRKSNVHAELTLIKKAIEADQNSDGKFIDLFRIKGLSRAMLVCTGLMTIAAMSGIVAVLGYTQTIFNMAKSSIRSDYSSMIVGCVSVFATIASTQLIERLGRKLLITASCSLVCLALSCLGVFFYLQEHNFNTESLEWLPVCSLMLFMFGYYFGMASIIYIILGELFPSDVKAVASSFCTSINFSFSFIVTLAFPYLFQTIGAAFTFWLFAACTGLGVIFCIFIVPETKGKSLQEIHLMLHKE